MFLSRFGTMDVERIHGLADKYGVQFPEDYIDFLVLTNGGFVWDDPDTKIEVPGTDELFQMKMFYGLDVEERFNLETVNNKYRDELPPSSFIIGEDSRGNQIVIVHDDEGDIICYWDEKLKLSVSSKDANAYILFNSFEEFWKDFYEITIKEYEGEKDMEKIDYVPLGSVVLLNGGIQKILVIGRGLIVNQNDKEFFFDYAGVPYPDGMLGEQVFYFNHDGLAKVVYAGFSDDDDKVVVDNINQYLADHPETEKGDSRTWNQ